MSTRALSPSPHVEDSCSSSPHWRRQCGSRLCRLLPTSLILTVCSFLSVRQVVCILRSTWKAFNCCVTDHCQLLYHVFLDVNSRSLPSLVASQPSTRALVHRIRSLSLYCLYAQDRVYQQTALLPLNALRCAVDSSRFLFSSVSSLYVCFGASLEAQPAEPLLAAGDHAGLPLLSPSSPSRGDLPHRARKLTWGSCLSPRCVDCRG